MRDVVATGRWLLRVAVIFMVASSLGACEKRSDGVGTEAEDALRIVSLTPAVSQMLVDLGLGGAIVGVSENDDAAPDGLPVVGTFLDVNAERLIALQPTHIALMHGKEGPPASLLRLVDGTDAQVAAYRYTDTLDEVLAMLAGPLDGATPVGAFVGHAEEAEALAARVREQMAAIAEAVEGEPRPRVLMVFGMNPVMASGSGTVLDELLQIAGGENAAAGNGLTAPVYDREALLRVAPEVILLLMPGAPPLVEGDARLAELRGLPIPAVEQGRIHLIHDELVLLPSTQMPRIAAAMARVLHPDRSEAIDAIVARSGGPDAE